jgi:hypothetical protein
MTQKDDNWKPEQTRRILDKEFMQEKQDAHFDDEMALTDADRLVKLERFYREVARLTLNHDVLADHAVVFPSKLGPVLEEVDKEWWKQK